MVPINQKLCFVYLNIFKPLVTFHIHWYWFSIGFIKSDSSFGSWSMASEWAYIISYLLPFDWLAWRPRIAISNLSSFWHQGWWLAEDLGMDDDFKASWLNYIQTFGDGHIHPTDKLDELIWVFSINGFYNPKLCFVYLNIFKPLVMVIFIWQTSPLMVLIIQNYVLFIWIFWDKAKMVEEGK